MISIAQFLPISGIAGVVLVVFGIIAYLFTGNIADPYVLIHLGLGALSLGTYVYSQGGNLTKTLGRRAARYGAHSLLYTVLFAGVIVMVNFLSARYHYRWDITEARVYSLSPQSVKVLNQLKQDILVYGFFERGENPKAADLIKGYTYISPKVKFYPVDPDRHPEMAKQFKVQQMNTLHLQYGKESTNVTDPSEESVTNAIIKLTKATKKNIYFLTGHGEPKLDDRENTQGFAGAKDALENENYQVQDLLLSTQEKVPAQASLLIIAGPEKPLLDHEVQAIEAYLKNGGRLLALLPSTGGEGLKGILKDWGVDAGDDLVVDQVIRLFAGPSLGVEPIVESYNPAHPITRDFKERTIFPMVRSVTGQAALKPGTEVAWLAQTSPTSWAEKDVNGIFKQGRASLGPEDKKGPVSVAVAFTANLKKIGLEKEGDAKIVAIGTAAFANNRYINIYFNRDFLLNAINWLVGQEELISIRPRSVRSSRIQLTEGEGSTVFYLSFLILPEILLIIGLSVWWRRR